MFVENLFVNDETILDDVSVVSWWIVGLRFVDFSSRFGSASSSSSSILCNNIH